jgi:ribosomal protein S18 acetylase RimI-like enzyme
MTKMDGIEVGRLTAGDAGRYNEFLLRGVREHRDTLRISENDILRAPFVTAGDGAATFVALTREGNWAGTVAVERERGREKREHIAWIVRMYVASEHGGRGVGNALLAHAMDYARTLPGVAKLNLTVAAHNQHAVRLYQRHGFREFSRELDAFRDPTPRTELSLSVALER